MHDKHEDPYDHETDPYFDEERRIVRYARVVVGVAAVLALLFVSAGLLVYHTMT